MGFEKRGIAWVRFPLLFLLVLLVLLLAGCAGKTGRSDSARGLSGGAGEETAGSSRDGTGAGSLQGGRLKVVTTIFPQYDFARHIAGENADVSMLLKPGEEVHSYEPTPQDVKMIQNSDLFIYTGGENDVWVESILESLGENGPRTVRMLDLVTTVAEEDLEGMMPEKGDHDHDHGHGEPDPDADGDGHAHEEEEHGQEDEDSGDADHVHEEENSAEEDGPAQEDEEHGHRGEGGHVHGEEPDEHVWTSPENCVTLLEKLTEEFCLADPSHAAAYRENGGEYRNGFVQLDEEYRRMAASASRRTILFGDRFPFRYLAEELGLTCYAAFSGCSSESEPSAATVAFLIDKAAGEKLPVVFKIEFSNGMIAQAVCEAAQLRMKKNAAKDSDGTAGTQVPQMQVLQLHSCHNVTRDEFSSGETCLSLMRKNLEALRTALGA